MDYSLIINITLSVTMVILSGRGLLYSFGFDISFGHSQMGKVLFLNRLHGFLVQYSISLDRVSSVHVMPIVTSGKRYAQHPWQVKG